ncbi:uncharacterized protein TRIVIDRAFT_224597 [Trichoderma virens Gv29-8]|uniref:F-box domain-containing protein n=1 Tax=Hypocrea virens (strain Gv29-8 / FGSC 10586) TaxID=413071 RepID=G9N0R1_HYPVG|nr:uncharacterized protein TRIVIDRAFT_224597 [Trichoderma virens Gv29-8]EHK19943.1 hypothetical protein TRIVIDRAFT_224597 [Trichoderma virens Gv29-8]UKZ53320.1 hypothetical protein TrVGV298_007112 [Trichoderma virens]
MGGDLSPTYISQPSLTEEEDANLALLERQHAITSEPGDKSVCYPYLALLPSEIIENVVSRLDNRTVKNLRLTFFRAIADHDALRHRIVEIIYDDARLWRSAVDAYDAREPREPGSDSTHIPTDMGRFQSERDENIEDLRQRRRRDDER